MIIEILLLIILGVEYFIPSFWIRDENLRFATASIITVILLFVVVFGSIAAILNTIFKNI